MTEANKQQEQQEEMDTTLQVPVFGYELIRDMLIPDLLGKDHAQIIYWSGKQLARRFTIGSQEEIAQFFKEAGWGELELIEQKKNEIKYLLSGEMVKRRLKLNKDAIFQLEAGFLAEQVQRQKNKTAEAIEEQKKRNEIYITVQWDK
ncbi:putative hydrocarbon binding protein [Bacillus tianshenii]|uniref:Hydrocarbon binding protein n=1 Tax=Sutcliffiella tianshenii TaxID=1463404 RepID=A0ABS2P0P4_9BACI|nr:YslB family protein [Bacillus tianshenii]MBM7620508.1 putative hydrocarbon binding protein [Bacillus tianshenii]